MILRRLLSGLGLALCGVRADPCPAIKDPIIHSPGGSPVTFYGRSAVLADGTVLATSEHVDKHRVFLPIYISKDGGSTWSSHAKVKSPDKGWHFGYQPFLYVLPEDFAGFEAGTVLLVAQSQPLDHSSTRIDVYASLNGGKHFRFVSSVASGGPPIATNNFTPVWEPFLTFYKGHLICYYSDQRDNHKVGQKISFQTTRDLVSWSAPRVAATDEMKSARIGMASVVQMSNNKWAMSYEFIGYPGLNGAVFVRISDSPLTFKHAPPLPVEIHGRQIAGNPYMIFWPGVGLAINALSDSAIFINRHFGATGKWEAIVTDAPKSYSRSLTYVPQCDEILIVGAGTVPTTQALLAHKLSVTQLSRS